MSGVPKWEVTCFAVMGPTEVRAAVMLVQHAPWDERGWRESAYRRACAVRQEHRRPGSFIADIKQTCQRRWCGRKRVQNVRTCETDRYQRVARVDGASESTAQ